MIWFKAGQIQDHTFPFKHREREPIIYDGDLMDEDNVLDFLTSLEAMDLPDRIEEVNGKILSKIIEDTEFVAVLFCEYMPRSSRMWGIYFPGSGYQRSIVSVLFV